MAAVNVVDYSKTFKIANDMSNSQQYVQFTGVLSGVILNKLNYHLFSTIYCIHIHLSVRMRKSCGCSWFLPPENFDLDLDQNSRFYKIF